MDVAVTLEVALVFELLSTELAAVQLTVLTMDGCQVRCQRRLPPEHLATKLTLKIEMSFKILYVYVITRRALFPFVKNITISRKTF